MRRPRRLQWTLRSLFILTTACAVFAAIEARHCREREAIKWLEGIGAHVTVETTGPAWLRELVGDRWFEHAVKVERFEDGMKPDGPLGCTLLTLDDIDKLGRLPKLRSLNLRMMLITDEALQRLGRFGSLEDLSLGGRCTCSMAAIEELADAHPDWAIDMALAEHLYRSAAVTHSVGTLDLSEALFSMQTAAAWKLACNKYKSGRQSEIAAHQQHLDWLMKLQQQVEDLATDGLAGGGTFELAFVKCAIADARLRLTLARRNARRRRGRRHRGPGQ
jgi:hypothetical protein